VERLGKGYFYGKADLAHDNYLFFPLHYYAESQLTVRARPYANQEFLIEYIARSLPQGYKLYVKEHPNVLGTFSLSMLRRIKKISNVVLVNPAINPHDLIANSKAVVTINSTAGFEALMHFKPVIVFGQAFYRGYGVTFDVDSLYDLEWTIKKALGNEVSNEKIIRFVAAVRRVVYDGSLDEPERLAESIIQKVKECLG
jgi:capsule polysaccharide modification protein KpsS